MAPDHRWSITPHGDDSPPPTYVGAPSSATAGPRRTLCRYRESGLNFQTGSPRLPVIEIGSQGQI
eukprot:5220864-Prymnesium_polylepis.1